MKKVLITGAKGQLGLSIRSITEANMPLELIFTDREELDITQKDAVLSFFRDHDPDYCINCAAYTQVDQAEKEPEKCFLINVIGVENLVAACSEVNCVLLHVSTDFVFDGSNHVPYKETDFANPINVYGESKYEAEQVIRNAMTEYFIIRTSWVYSGFGNNFLKTIIRLGKDKDEIRVINDQFGNPTYALDLAKFILQVLESGNKEFGVYNFTNRGMTTWFDFAKEILKHQNREVNLVPIVSEEFHSEAKRPKYSSLDLTKTEQTFSVIIPDWREGLMDCFKQMELYENENLN